MGIARKDFEAMKARTLKVISNLTPDDAFTGREADLHRQIEVELKHRRWYYVHSRTDKRTTTALGVPDFIIAGKSDSNFDGEPVTYWIEVKKRGGKLTPEQTITKHLLTALGHRYATVYSFAEFLEAIG